jgi:hypothetical protein
VKAREVAVVLLALLVAVAFFWVLSNSGLR